MRKLDGVSPGDMVLRRPTWDVGLVPLWDSCEAALGSNRGDRDGFLSYVNTNDAALIVAVREGSVFVLMACGRMGWARLERLTFHSGEILRRSVL